ncbi:endonuclease/exonuclease/phosphatase family protein [Snuella lapsa]|uniref:Endonuclease/exonuclease/phosphatase family protein n=1 Tax=Snuella lapsa TaxID=870481 RepID=A0ABP6WN25_9FLAO
MAPLRTVNLGDITLVLGAVMRYGKLLFLGALTQTNKPLSDKFKFKWFKGFKSLTLVVVLIIKSIKKMKVRNGINLCFVIAFLVFQINVVAQVKVDSSRVVRVLTYNIYHGETVDTDKKFDLDLLAKIIGDTRPDLVAMQEVDFKTKRARNFDLVTELGQRTKLVPLFGKAMAFDGGEYGEGILSRYTFLTTQNHALNAREGKEPRAALEVKIVLKSGDTIRFVATHLDHTKDETDRIMQANELNAIFSDNMPTIMAGDLNALPESETIKILSKKWTSSFLDNAPTFPAIDPKKKIDYILYKPEGRWRVLETHVIDEKKASDHRPVLSVLELLKP